jgi:hypothetical protein
MRRESDIVGNMWPICHPFKSWHVSIRAAVCRRHLAGGPITGNGYYYWLGIEAAGDNNFYGLDGSLFGKVRPYTMVHDADDWLVDFSDESNTYKMDPLSLCRRACPARRTPTRTG